MSPSSTPRQTARDVERAEQVIQHAASVARAKPAETPKLEPVMPRVVSADELRRRQDEQDRCQRADRAASLAASAGVPLRYRIAALDWRHDPPYDAALQRLHALSTAPGMLGLIGPRGTGKTYLACATVNLFCSRGQTAMYRRVADFFIDLKDTFGQDRKRTQRDVVNQYARPQLLALDEMQVRSDSDWENVVLTDLIDRRYAEHKSTLMIANLTSSEFAKRIGESVVSRLSETGGLIVCDWKSFRGNS